MEEAPEQVIALLNKFAVFPQTISLIALIIAPVNPRRANMGGGIIMDDLDIKHSFSNGTIEEELAWHYIMLASRKAPSCSKAKKIIKKIV